MNLSGDKDLGVDEVSEVQSVFCKVWCSAASDLELWWLLMGCWFGLSEDPSSGIPVLLDPQAGCVRCAPWAVYMSDLSFEVP